MAEKKESIKGIIIWGVISWVSFLAAFFESATEGTEIPSFVVFFAWFALPAFFMNDKGHGKINNIFWGVFANIAGWAHVATRDYKKGSKAYKQKQKELADIKRRQAQIESKQKAASRRAEIARKKQITDATLSLKNKYGNEDATKALAGKIWVNMPFNLFHDAHKLMIENGIPNGRKFGKKFQNVVNGEERHKYRFDPYENRQGKTSYNYEVDTKAGLITGWKEL
tara:strand:- start:182 stop:856 length:675 start_codon:yes stop_codon:yes gene_type:complete